MKEVEKCAKRVKNECVPEHDAESRFYSHVERCLIVFGFCGTIPRVRKR